MRRAPPTCVAADHWPRARPKPPSSMLAKPFVALLRRLLPSLPLRRAFHSDLHACVSLIQLCAARRNLTRARELHAHLLTTGLHSSRFAVSALISLYSKCSRPAEAFSVFLSDRSQNPDLFVWNAALSALASNDLPADALRLFRRLFSEVGLSPDEFTFPCAIKACSDLGDSDVLQQIHAALFKVGFSDEMFAASALVHAYLKMGLLNQAEQVFDVLPQRDVVLWNSMVNGFAHLGQFALSLDYFRRMINEGVIPSKYTVTGVLSVFTARVDLRNGRKIHAFVLKTRYDNEISVSNSLINLYGKCHLLEDAEGIFESMQEKDVVSWNSMISAYQYSAHHSKTLQLFCQMRRNGIMLDAITVAAVLPACSHLAALRLGRKIHGLAITSSMSAKDVFVVNALMDMYAKCGTLEDARFVFDRMLEPNVTSWNIMIDAYGIHGQGAEAVDLFEQMVGVGLAPDEITFVGVLSACSHAGLVETGKELLHRMESEFGLTPAMEHYSSVADMLGRAGFLEEAKGVAEKAGVRGAGVWRAYLAACRMHGEAGQAVEAAERVVEMEPQGSGSYVLMASAYGGAGKFNELAEVRSQMSQKGVRKAPGCSWVEVAGARLHAFVAGDQNHPEAEEIYTALHGLFGWMREELGHSTEVIAFHGE